MNFVKTAFLLGCMMTWAAAFAGEPAAKVDNFVLLDHRGEAVELYYQSDVKAVVLITQANGCKSVHAQLADFKALGDNYADRGVRVFMINSSPDDSRADIAAEAEALGIDMPVLDDSAQLVGRSLQLNQTSEVLVIDTGNWTLAYRGSPQGASGALDSLLAGEAVAFAATEPDGCLVNYPEYTAEISYAKTIAPILEKNCVHCHSEGGIAPWAMSDYRMVQGFAPMMREVIRTKQMPPWHADPAVGEWQHDAGLSDEDASLLISWIEAGAPRGEGEDPLAGIEPPENKWTLGEPDLIIDIPAYDVPASGVVDYTFPFVNNPLDRDVWVVAATIIPGDTQAVHHVLMGSADQPPTDNDREGVFQNYIMGYAPGNESAYMPEGTGVFVPVGGVYLFQMHYTPYGKASTDKTRVGLYFAKPDQPPENFLRQHVVLNPKISIPPQDAAHEEFAYFEFWDDATLYSLVPHSHYRGRSSTFELAYPDGRTELILSVPNYDFNWQRTYSFTEPKSVPKGTRIIHRTVYDNSPRNPANPNPERTVPWGLQSHDEMLYGSVSFAWANESVDQPLHNNQRADTAQWMGFMDQNMDGLVQRDEMSERLRSAIGWKWYLLDRNFDGGLNLAEMERLVQNLNSGP
jgi:hypothetical protein